MQGIMPGYYSQHQAANQAVPVHVSEQLIGEVIQNIATLDRVLYHALGGEVYQAAYKAVQDEIRDATVGSKTVADLAVRVHGLESQLAALPGEIAKLVAARAAKAVDTTPVEAAPDDVADVLDEHGNIKGKDWGKTQED